MMIDDKPENFFAQFATDPEEYFDVAADKIMPPEQLAAWKKDRAGCVVDADLARRHNWKIGDRVTLQGTIFPTNLDLTIRGIYTSLILSDVDRPPKIVLITSSLPGEGKSSTAIALARLVARAGKRVVLIDSDLRPVVQRLAAETVAPQGHPS